tara:strand:+ start:1663 stop:2391 length:729 start_codon:yes stop_codon:yes gene_type:complete
MAVNPLVVAMAVKAGLNMGKSAMSWLDAKKSKYEMSSQQTEALASATNQSNQGLGVAGFNAGVNEIKGQTDNANQKINQNLYASGLENSFAVADTKAKVQQVSTSQIASLALKIADKNKEFRKNASARKENMLLQISAEEKAFKKNRKERMRTEAFSFLSAGVDAYVAGKNLKASADQSKLDEGNLAMMTKDITQIEDWSSVINGHIKKGDYKKAMEYLDTQTMTAETKKKLNQLILDSFKK